ncbi:MAG: hypothetical protein LBP20_06150 [Treponema sp.]|jgi:hypothetical protein|nr:hypothetical protein [Treponema sp.]
MLKFSTPALFLCSLFMALVLFFAVFGSLFRELYPRYAVLTFEEADGETARALERALERPVVSEFSQWVFLNSFGSLERVSLENYEDRLEPFDPRRDGYAVKLRNFFTRDGKRWFFIPLDRSIFGPFPVLNPERALKKKIAGALDSRERSFSLILRREGWPLVFRALPFAAAWPAALFLAGGALFPKRRGGSRRSGSQGPGRRLLLLLAPPLFVVSLWGAPGCALLALFLYLAVLSAPPLREFWVRVIRGGNGKPRRFAAPGPYRFNITLSLVLAPLAVLVVWAGRIPPLSGLLAFAGLFALYFWETGLQVWRLTPGASPGPGDRDSCRFVPLPILPPCSGRSLLPASFALVSCLAFPLDLPVVWGGPAEPEPWPLVVSERDYENHVRYQTGFSRRSLRSSGDTAFAALSYFRYTVGEDGLVTGILPGPPEAEPEIPPFPLADLNDYLAEWAVPVVPRWKSGEWIAVIPSLLALGLVVLPGGGKKRMAVYDDKRIAA